jgi:hypothetical protein
MRHHPPYCRTFPKGLRLTAEPDDLLASALGGCHMFPVEPSAVGIDFAHCSIQAVAVARGLPITSNPDPRVRSSRSRSRVAVLLRRSDCGLKGCFANAEMKHFIATRFNALRTRPAPPPSNRRNVPPSGRRGQRCRDGRTADGFSRRILSTSPMTSTPYKISSSWHFCSQTVLPATVTYLIAAH